MHQRINVLNKKNDPQTTMHMYSTDLALLWLQLSAPDTLRWAHECTMGPYKWFIDSRYYQNRSVS